MSSASVARLPLLKEGLLAAAREIGALAAARSPDLDEDFSFPVADFIDLHRLGLLLAPFPRRFGGNDIATGISATQFLFLILRQVGAANLSLGRLFEGHVNAVGLLTRYGRAEQVQRIAEEVAQGTVMGVWNTDGANGARLVSDGPIHRLIGGKILCSGAGFIERPLITAKDEAGRVIMVMPRLLKGERADLSSWTPLGMRASATGAVDFTDIRVGAEDIVGEADAYQVQPFFAGGAWRFAAVQLGGMERLLDLLREHLVRTKRGGDPHQRARMGECLIAVETAKLWVERAAVTAERGVAKSDSIVAYVNLARIAVERAALNVLEFVHRSVGLSAFVRPNPIERISRDLATYLRQPAPDSALTNAAAWALGQQAAFLDLWD